MYKLNTFFWFAFALIVWNACASQAKPLDDNLTEGPLVWMGNFNSREQKSVKNIASELSTTIAPISFEKIGSRLFYIERSNELNWYEAESFCQENGGHLAAFENLEEYNAVRNKLPGFDLYWIGINDQAEEGVFVSSASGEPAPYLNWLRSQPDSAGDEDCVQMFGSTSFNGLNDNICSKKMLFICQADEIAN